MIRVRRRIRLRQLTWIYATSLWLDDGLYGEMRQERQPAQPRHCGARPDLFEAEQSAGDHHSGECAARQAAKTEERRPICYGDRVPVHGAHDGTDQDKPQ